MVLDHGAANCLACLSGGGKDALLVPVIPTFPDPAAFYPQPARTLDRESPAAGRLAQPLADVRQMHVPAYHSNIVSNRDMVDHKIEVGERRAHRNKSLSRRGKIERVALGVQNSVGRRELIKDVQTALVPKLVIPAAGDCNSGLGRRNSKRNLFWRPSF